MRARHAQVWPTTPKKRLKAPKAGRYGARLGAGVVGCESAGWQSARYAGLLAALSRGLAAVPVFAAKARKRWGERTIHSKSMQRLDCRTSREHDDTAGAIEAQG